MQIDPATAESDAANVRDIVSLALKFAAENGMDQAEASASLDLGLSVTARLGDVESLEHTNDRALGITVFSGGRKGSASTSDFRDIAVREAVDKACTFAKHTEQDEFAGLADAERMAKSPPDLDLSHPWDIDARAAIDMTIACETAGRDHDTRITNSEGATLNTFQGVRAYGNSHGFLGSYPKTSHSLSCVLVGEADGGMERDYWYTSARKASDLESADHVGVTAAERTVARLRSRKMNTTSAPVILVPEVATGFIGHAVSAVSGSAQYRRSSFLLDAAGEKIFPEFVRLQERPHLAGAMASAPYDAEGVGTADRDLVSGGVLQGYVLGSYSARKLGLESTGNAGGTHNLIVPGNADGLVAMQKEMGTGLIVHELIGQGVNAVTGDYSRGAVGFWVEDGEIAYPVHEITIAGNLRELYQRIARIGNDQDLRGRIRCGSILIEEMQIAGA